MTATSEYYSCVREKRAVSDFKQRDISFSQTLLVGSLPFLPGVQFAPLLRVFPRHVGAEGGGRHYYQHRDPPRGQQAEAEQGVHSALHERALHHGHVGGPIHRDDSAQLLDFQVRKLNSLHYTLLMSLFLRIFCSACVHLQNVGMFMYLSELN